MLNNWMANENNLNRRASDYSNAQDRRELDRDLLLVLRLKLENIEDIVEQATTNTEKNKEKVESQLKELTEKMDEKFKEMKELIDENLQDSEEKYVTKESFTVVRMLVYGLAGAILMAVVNAVIKLPIPPVVP